MEASKHILKLVENGQLEYAIDCSLDSLEFLDDDTRNAFLLNKSRLSDLINNYNRGTVSLGEYQLKKNNISESVLSILTTMSVNCGEMNIRDEFLKKYPIKRNSLRRKFDFGILVVLLLLIMFVLSYVNDLKLKDSNAEDKTYRQDSTLQKGVHILSCRSNFPNTYDPTRLYLYIYLTPPTFQHG